MYKPGDKIYHGIYGEGMIDYAQETDDVPIYSIEFKRIPGKETIVIGDELLGPLPPKYSTDDMRHANKSNKREKKEENKMMNPNVKRHYDIVMGLNDLYAKKNADYGDSFHDTYVEEGMAMPRIRLSDKLNRFKSLTRSNNQQVADESIRDTLLDLANYAIMTVIEMDKEKHNAE